MEGAQPLGLCLNPNRSSVERRLLKHLPGLGHHRLGVAGSSTSTTVDKPADPDDLALGCTLDGHVVQEARTSDLVFSVPRLVADLSAVVSLLAGDVIFTGTPSMVGVARDPNRSFAPARRSSPGSRGSAHLQPHPLSFRPSVVGVRWN